jgi:phage terminase Nu1 subunit (DNA packaging protein)
MATRDKTTQEVAEMFSVDPSTINNWTKHGLPCDKAKTKKQSNKYDVAEVAAWMKINNRTGEMGRPPEPGSENKKALEERKLLALVLKYERENAIEDGKLIDAAQEQQRDVQKVVAVRNKLWGMGATLSPQLEGLEGHERQSLIDAYVENVLKEFGENK